MSRSIVLQNTWSLGWNMGCSSFSEPGCHRSGCRTPLTARTLESVSIDPNWFVALDCCICLSHSMHVDYYLVANGLSGECSWHRFGSTTAQPLHFSSSFFFRCLVSFLSQQSDAKWPRHWLQSGAQASRRCLSFSHVYHFGDGHVSIPDLPFCHVGNP